VNISFEIIQTAIAYLHGNDIPDRSTAKNDVSLLLVARAFGISSLEDRVKRHLTEKLDRQFECVASEIQIIEVVNALREMYGQLSGEVAVGKEVVGIVTGTAARACCRKLATLKKSSEFMVLLKEVPQLAYDILASDVEVYTIAKKDDSVIESEERVKMVEDAEQEAGAANSQDSSEEDGGDTKTRGALYEETGAEESEVRQADE
jgi:hypothetical protein